jgi:hypothetical protein
MREQHSEHVNGIVATRESLGEIQPRVAESLGSSDSLLHSLRIGVSRLDGKVLLKHNPHSFLKGKRLSRLSCGRLSLSACACRQEKHCHQ